MSLIPFKIINEGDIYKLEKYRYKVDVYEPTGVVTSYVDDVNTFLSRVNPRIETNYSNFTLKKESESRLSYINSLGITTLTDLGGYLDEISKFIESGFVHPSSESELLRSLYNENINVTTESIMEASAEILKGIRKSKIMKGMTYKGLTVDLSSKSLSSINNLITMINHGVMQEVVFKCEEGKYLTLKGYNEVENFYKDVNAYIQSCFLAENNVIKKVGNSDNKEFVEAADAIRDYRNNVENKLFENLYEEEFEKVRKSIVDKMLGRSEVHYG